MLTNSNPISDILLNVRRNEWPLFDVKSYLQTLKEFIAIVSFLSVFIYSLVIYPFAFNFETYEHGNYAIAFFTILSATLHSSLSIFDKEDKLHYPNIILIVLLGFEVQWISSGNEYASVIGAFGIQLCLIISLPFHRLKIIMYSILALYVAQLIYAGYNLINDDKYPLEGSLQNSGVFAMYCIIFIPISAYLMQRYLKGKLYNVLISIYIVVIILIVIYTKSRTSVISLLLVFVLPNLVSWVKKQSASLKAVLLILVLILAGVTLRYLFFLKTASSMGRVLMLDVAISHIKDNFWFGLGLGKFTWYYPQWQAGYFKSVSNSSGDYFLSAGETYVIFNEYLQLFISIGAIGFIILSLLLTRLFRNDPHSDERLFKVIKTTIFLILSCSLTYYTTHVNVILLFITFLIALSVKICRVKDSFSLKGFNISVKIFVCAASFLSLALSFKKYYAVIKWSETKRGLTNLVDIHHPENNYIFSTLKSDGKFLAEYGSYIFEHGSNLATPIHFLEKSKQTFISRKNIEDLAYLYLQQKQYEKAAENFEWLVNYMPNIFMNRLELLKIYHKLGATNKAKKMALSISSMPIKIPSSDINYIKSEAAKIYNQL